MSQYYLLFAFFATVVSLTQASNTCVNDVTKFTVIGDVQYELGSEKRLPLSANETKYQCGEMGSELRPDSAQADLDTILASAMSQSYLPQLNSKPENCFKDGKSYCCEEGVKYYNLMDVKGCILNDGERVQDGKYKITARSDTVGKVVTYGKFSVVVNYGCNQEARQKVAALRFNGKIFQRCKEFS